MLCLGKVKSRNLHLISDLYKVSIYMRSRHLLSIYLDCLCMYVLGVCVRVRPIIGIIGIGISVFFTKSVSVSV